MAGSALLSPRPRFVPRSLDECPPSPRELAIIEPDSREGETDAVSLPASGETEAVSLRER